MKFGLDPRANHRPSRVTIVVSAAIASLLLLALVILAAVAPRAIPLLPYTYVNAEFHNASNLRPLAAVQISGRRVGQVSAVTYGSNGLVDVKLQLLPGTETLTSDATARIRLANPIGARYVEISPSNSGTALHDNGTIPVSHTSTAVDVQTLLSGFNAPTRTNITSSVIGLGQGFIGRGTGINEELSIADPELTDLNNVSTAILAIPQAASRFIPSADSLADAYDPVRTQLAAGFKPQAEALQDFGDERGNLQQTLDVAPSTLTALQTGLAKSDPMLVQMTGLARATISLTRPAPAALAAATQLLKTGVPSLRRSLPLLHAVDNAVNPTLTLLDKAYPVLQPSTTVMQEQMRPLTTLVSHECDFLQQTINWRSAMAWGVPGDYDPTSHLTQLEPGLGPDINSFRVLALAPDTTETLDADAPGNFPHGTDAYPAPCEGIHEVLK